MANEFIIRKGYKSLAASEVTGSLTTTGNIVGEASGYLQRLYIQDKKALDSSSNFLYIDPNTQFGSGIYINNAVRIDGGLLGSYNEDLQLRTGTTTRITIANADGAVRFHNYGAGYLKTDSSGNITVDTSTIEDTLDSVTDRGATTTNNITVGNVTLNSKLTFDYGGDHYFEAGTNSIAYKSSGGSSIMLLNASTKAATFAGTVTAKGEINVTDSDGSTTLNHVRAYSNGTEGVLNVNNGSNWGFVVRGPGNDPRIGAWYGGTLKIEGFHSSDGATGANAIDFAQFQFGNNHFLVNAASNRFTGFVGIKTPSSYTANTNADDLIVGSGTGNQGITIYSGDSNSGAIYFADDLDEEGAGDSPAGNRDGVIQYSHNNTRFDFKTGGNQQALRLTNSNAIFENNVTVQGTLTAQEFHTEFVSASILYESGSTKFGDTSDDNHNFTGSINLLSGSLNITGPFSDPGTPLTLHNSINAAGVSIRFTDTQAGTSQYGRLTYRHSDSQSQGGGASFHFTAEPDTVLVVGDSTNKGRFAAYSSNNAAEVDYGFAGDTNTGMYQPAAGSLGLVRDGSRKLLVTGDGVKIQNGRFYLDGTVDTNTTSTAALVLNGTEVEQRTLGSAAFANTGDFLQQGSNSAGYTGDMDSLTGLRIIRSTAGSNRAFAAHHNVIQIPNTSVSSYNAQLAFETGTTSNGGVKWRSSTNGTFTSWYKIWHEGNDGAGSGLDADTLDGNHASAFLTSYTETDTLSSVTGRGSTTTNAITVGGTATGGNRILSQTYSGNNRLGVISSHNSSGNIMIGYGLEGKSGSSGYVSTYGNFSGRHGALEIYGAGFKFVGDTSNSTTSIGSDITTTTYFNLNSGNLTLSGDLTVTGGDITLGGDTNIYRSAANTLKTDDSLEVDGRLYADAAFTVTQAASDQSTSQDSTTIPSTTISELIKFQGGYTNGQYTTELVKVDRSGNLPLYFRQSKGTANSFTNLIRIGDHGQTNGTDIFAVFGSARVDGTLTAANVTATSVIYTDEIRDRTGQDLTITAGEASGYLSQGSHNDEIIRLAAEGGVKVYSSTDNLTSGLNKVTTLIDSSGHMSIAGDLTVSGGDITLSGTGRIQGIDTVSANTDAANKLYVDNAIAGVGGVSAPNAPTSLTTSIVGNTINVGFTASTTSDIDLYLVFSSVSGSDYSLISVIPPDDFGSTMSIIDDSFDESGVQAYRVYAQKNGAMSSALTGNITYSVTTPLEPTNMSVVNLNTAYYVQWDPPSSNARFVTAYNVYKHEHATQSSLSRSSATLIYSGMNTSYMYQINGNNNLNFHQFWVETTVA